MINIGPEKTTGWGNIRLRQYLREHRVGLRENRVEETKDLRKHRNEETQG